MLYKYLITRSRDEILHNHSGSGSSFETSQTILAQQAALKDDKVKCITVCGRLLVLII